MKIERFALEYREAATRALDGLIDLTDRERRILQARTLGEPPLTLKSLGAEFGISQARVRQIEGRVFRRIIVALGKTQQEALLEAMRKAQQEALLEPPVAGPSATAH